MFVSITNKQIRLLKRIQKHSLVLARWDHQDMVDLLRMRLVETTRAYTTSGRTSAYLIWTISERGTCFLQEERAGR